MTFLHHPPAAFLPPSERPELHEAAVLLAVRGGPADRERVRGEADLLTAEQRAWLDGRGDDEWDNDWDGHS